jgi:hypothetical protein
MLRGAGVIFSRHQGITKHFLQLPGFAADSDTGAQQGDSCVWISNPHCLLRVAERDAARRIRTFSSGAGDINFGSLNARKLCRGGIRPCGAHSLESSGAILC